MSSKKFKLFIENIVIYGFGGILNKAIALIMVPIVTDMIPNKGDYGISDLSNTLVSFGSTIALVGMYDAMYRLFFDRDDNDYKKTVCSTALGFTILTSLIAFAVLLLGRVFFSRWFFSDSKYSYVVIISAITVLAGSTNSIVSAPTRMLNRRITYVLVNFFAPIVSYSIALVLLSKGYYVIGVPIGCMISAILVEVFFIIQNCKWFSLKNLDFSVLKELLWIGVPVLPNILIYWVFNSCDKIMITNILGIDYSGVYSTSSKVGQISQLIYIAFAGGWQYFAFSTMKEKGQVESNSKVFEYLSVVAFAASIFMCSISYIFFRIVFKPDYWDGYIAAPYLFLAPLLQMLYQVIGNQFAVVKKNWISPLVLALGAAVNLLLNRLLIPILGIEGASIATLFGYVSTIIVTIVVLLHMKLLIFPKRLIFSGSIITIYFIIWRMTFRENTLISVLCAIAFSALLLLMYFGEIKELSRMNSMKIGSSFRNKK